MCLSGHVLIKKNECNSMCFVSVTMFARVALLVLSNATRFMLAGAGTQVRDD